MSDPDDVTTSSDDRDEGEPEIDLLPAALNLGYRN